MNQAKKFLLSFRDIIEYSSFGVCSYIGEKINIRASSVRIHFIYLSFVTLGSPVILYFFVMFWMNIKKHLRISKADAVYE
jgi:phage shock protein PspC (stress-responsive transcriptional regulator)